VAFEIDVSQAERGLLRIADFTDLAREPIERVVGDAARRLRASVVTALSRGGSGRVYRRGARRFGGNAARNVQGGVAIAFHRASRPGEPPARDTGALLHSVRAKLGRKRKTEIRDYVTESSPGFILESGSRSIRPRPHMVPAAEAERRDFVARVRAVIDEAVRLSNGT
jgi:hypothetical protein